MGLIIIELSGLLPRLCRSRHRPLGPTLLRVEMKKLPSPVLLLKGKLTAPPRDPCNSLIPEVARTWA